MKHTLNRAFSCRHRVLAALTLAVMPMLAGAELVSIAWNAAGRFETDMNVAPGKLAEVCGPLAPGQSVAWSFKADRPMNFNVHYHAGKQVVFAAQQDATAEAQGQLDVSLAQDYCWMWTNKTESPATLRLTLRR